MNIIKKLSIPSLRLPVNLTLRFPGQENIIASVKQKKLDNTDMGSNRLSEMYLEGRVRVEIDGDVIPGLLPEWVTPEHLFEATLTGFEDGTFRLEPTAQHRSSSFSEVMGSKICGFYTTRSIR